MRLDLALITEAAGLTVTGKAAALAEEDREDIRPLLIHFCLRHTRHIVTVEGYWQSILASPKVRSGFSAALRARVRLLRLWKASMAIWRVLSASIDSISGGFNI